MAQTLPHRPSLAKRFVIAAGSLWVVVGLAGQAQVQYNATYVVVSGTKLLAGETASLALRATNTGTAIWNNQGQCPVVLGYHWFRGSTRLASETQAAALPIPVSPGQTVELTATVNAPATAGSYTLVWDLRAQCEWFTALGGTAGRQQVEVVTKR